MKQLYLKNMNIINTDLLFESDVLKGKSIEHSERVLGDLKGIFRDEEVRIKMEQSELIYEVDCHFPVADGTSGGLFFGITKIYPGKVGDEYFMTKGHFHSQSDRGEYYWGIKGEGVLILMDKGRRTWGERMCPGSLHYIPAHVAHRVANIGDETLSFGACWPSDAGHNYEEIAEKGFSARLIDDKGNPLLISEQQA